MTLKNFIKKDSRVPVGEPLDENGNPRFVPKKYKVSTLLLFGLIMYIASFLIFVICLLCNEGVTQIGVVFMCSLVFAICPALISIILILFTELISMVFERKKWRELHAEQPEKNSEDTKMSGEKDVIPEMVCENTE